MRAGELDHCISIEAPPAAVDAYGQATGDWTVFAENIWAGRRDAGGREVFSAGRETALGTSVFRFYWLEGLRPDMVIVEAGQRYDILSIKELGRREGLEVVTELRRD